MSADNRSVTTDALHTLGNIITEGKRDAIHLAVEPMIAAETLYAGQHIGIVGNKASTKAEKKLGIVDPFLTGPVPAGSMFWFVVYPRQITSLEHRWSHPDFDNPKDLESQFHRSQKWITDWCKSMGLRYEYVMDVADANARGDWDSINMGMNEDAYVPDEFWDHYQIVRNTVVEQGNRASFFTCAC